MKLQKHLIASILLLFNVLHIKSQTIINFSYQSQAGNQANTFDNSGCALYHRFGPNPTVIDGYNVRTVGSTLMTYNAVSYGALNLYAEGNIKSSVSPMNNFVNAIVSVEYPFKANRTYQIDLVGRDEVEVWLDGTHRPASVQSVFWVKLDNNPEITTPVTNKCEWSYTPIERKIDRYSKLIANQYGPIDVTHTVTFSTLEDKRALKIAFDPSPEDRDFMYDGIFRLKNIKITELPYREETLSSQGSLYYYNVPIWILGPKTRNDPSYHIENGFADEPRSTRPRNPFVATVSPEQWELYPDGSAYSVSVKSLYPNLSYSDFTYLAVQDPNGNPRISGDIVLPASFQNNSFSYEIINGDLILKVTNAGNSRPTTNATFTIGGQ